MDSKSIQELINILVKKCGIDINSLASSNKFNILNERLNTLKSNENIFFHEKEIELLNSSLKKTPNLIEKYAKEILEAFENKRPYIEIENKLNYLVQESIKELNKTNAEIADSNVFNIVDNYSKEINAIEKKISSEKIDKKEEKDYYFYEIYVDTKKTFLLKRKDVLKNQIKAIDKFCLFLTEKIEKIKTKVVLLEDDLLKSKQKIYDNEIKQIEEKELKIMLNLFEKLEDEIKVLDEIVEKYMSDISKYRNNQISKKEELFEIEKELNESKITNVSNDINISKYIDEKIKSLQMTDRMNSISLEQQYLYVDSEVLKEEIRSLWEKNIPSESALNVEYFDI